MLYKKKKSRIHKKFRRLIAVFLIAAVIVTILFEAQAVPFTAKCVKKQSKTISTKIINKCACKVIEKYGFKYDDLSEIKYGGSGDVKSISTNTISVNKLKSKITLAIQSELDKERLYNFSLPLGAFTDLTMLSTLGPNIEVSFILTGSVNCRIKSKFESGGVNQTVHHIYLIVKTEIITISPEYKEKTVFTTDFEIAQTVIVGNIPSTYADIVR